MRKIAFVLLIAITAALFMCGFSAFGQCSKDSTYSSRKWQSHLQALNGVYKASNQFIIPLDTLYSDCWNPTGSIAVVGGQFYFYDGTAFITPTAAGSGITLLNTTYPMVGGPITTTGTVSIPKATTSAGGYLDSTDWKIFNSKQASVGDSIRRLFDSLLTRVRYLDTQAMLQNYAIEAQMLGYLGLKVNYSDSGSAYYSVYGVDTAKSALRQLIALRELLSNKVTNFSSPDNTTYPTTSAVNNLVGSYKIKSDSVADDGYTRRDRTQQVADSVAGLIDATVLPTANKIVRRDAYANGYVNNIIQSGTSTVAANGTNNMDLASTLFQEQTGSSGNDQTYVLPDATTLTEFTPYVFDNNSDGLMVVNDFTGSLVVSIAAGGKYEVRLKDNGSVAGTWDKHPYLPLGTNASMAGIQFTGFVNASGSVTGSNLSNTNTGDQNVFTSIPVSGQTTVTANSTTTALTLVAGSGIAITTDNMAKSITFTATGGGITPSDTAAMLGPYVRKADSNFNSGYETYYHAATTYQPIGTYITPSDTAAMLSPYLLEQHASVTYVAIVADTTISAAYTLTSRDFHRTIHCTNGSNIALTIPSGLGTTFTCVVLAEGAGTVTPTTSSTTFYYQPTSTTKIKSQGGATIRSWATANSYLIIGSLE